MWGIVLGSTLEVMKGDTRSLDCSSCDGLGQGLGVCVRQASKVGTLEDGMGSGGHLVVSQNKGIPI